MNKIKRKKNFEIKINEGLNFCTFDNKKMILLLIFGALFSSKFYDFFLIK